MADPDGARELTRHAVDGDRGHWRHGEGDADAEDRDHQRGHAGAGVGLQTGHQQGAAAGDEEPGEQQQARADAPDQPPDQGAEKHREPVERDEPDPDVPGRGAVHQPEVLAEREHQPDLSREQHGHDRGVDHRPQTYSCFASAT
ncbi:hypothetical protein [Actinospica robiniae]|uniref:hypothetical protein n=1 Tax=Actinospica robiniae TaxID=304901 RepID=UPI0012F7381F|nr:hypothetical protein [Actinospica robiniae]